MEKVVERVTNSNVSCLFAEYAAPFAFFSHDLTRRSKLKRILIVLGGSLLMLFFNLLS